MNHASMTGCGKVLRDEAGFSLDCECGEGGNLCPACATALSSENAELNGRYDGLRREYSDLQKRVEELEKQLTLSETLSQSREENRVRALKAWQDAEARVEELEAKYKTASEASIEFARRGQKVEKHLLELKNAILARPEWERSGEFDSWYWTCRWCGQTKSEGHFPDCFIQLARK